MPHKTAMVALLLLGVTLSMSAQESDILPRFRAELVGKRHVRLRASEGSAVMSFESDSYRFEDAKGRVIPVEAVFRTGDKEVQLYPSEDLDINRVYYLLLPSKQHVLCSFDGWMRHLFTPVKLGARYNAGIDSTVFRLLAPRATAVRLYLYRQRIGDEAYRIMNLRRSESGVWETTQRGNLEGLWYDYTVHGADEPGNEFFEQVEVHVTDPYARVVDDSFGRARVWPKATPPVTLEHGIPAMEDVIAYEVHVEDFTLQLTGLDRRKRGSFTGFAESGLRNSHGQPVGIDHLADLGINVVHLMPIQEYLHFPDDEWQAAFSDDEYMQSQLISESNYQWGYRTTHAFAIETRYREKGSDYGAQNRQFRDLVEAFHKRGIAVVVDVVFNHTAERMDGREMYFNFRGQDRHLYYRTDESLGFFGEYGTEVKSEERPMVARWIYDQCLALVNDYGVDGFRIDLAGLTDEQTLRELRRRLGPDILIYGEPWIGSSDPDYENNPDWDWYKKDAPITYFQDDTRNALCGSYTDPENKRNDRGYAGGNGDREAAKRAIANSFEFEDTPVEGINYLDIHDNWALADRFATADWNGEQGVDEGPYRIATAMLLTSLGPVILHGGSEFMRSKASALRDELVKRTATGPIYIHGQRDSYNLRRANLFQWENLGRNKADGAACNYQLMNDFWKGLIKLRRSQFGKVFRVRDRVPADYIHWVEPENSLQLGYVVGGTVFVLVNTDEQDASIRKIILPDGRWELVVDGYNAGTDLLSDSEHSTLEGGRNIEIRIAAKSVKIWIQRQTTIESDKEVRYE